MSFISDAWSFSFFQRAVLVSLLASVACGVMGTYIVVKRMSSVSGGLSHAAFGGVGLGYFLGFSPMLGAVGFGLLSGLLIAIVYIRSQENLDSLVAIVWSVGMALGALLIAITPGYAPDLSTYLFGSVLLVPENYVLAVVLLDLVLLACVLLFGKHLQAVAFDEEFCEVTGVPRAAVIMLLMLLTSLTVVILMRVVGAIMLIALLTTPAVIARHWSDSLRKTMILATGVALLCTSGGLFLSFWLSERYALNAPTGPLIILLCSGMFVVSSVVAKAASMRRA